MGHNQVTFVSGTASEAFQWIANEIGNPIDFRPVVAAIHAGDEVHSLAVPCSEEKDRVKLKTACGGKKAPRTRPPSGKKRSRLTIWPAAIRDIMLL
jgi:hypothetical protein